MQGQNLAHIRDESTKILYDYLSNNYYKHLIALSLILMFAIVFYLIHLLIDAFIDKERHYKLSLLAFERYEKSLKLRPVKIKKSKFKFIKAKQKKNSDAPLENKNQQNQNEISQDINDNKLDEIALRNKKIEYTVWTNRNLQISFIHSILCSIWLIRIICFRNTEMFNDLVVYVSWDTYLVLAFSCGYFLYDFYDIYANGYFLKEWVICLHHWIVLISFSYHMMYLINIGYTIIALLMEFNSVFLHSRKLLKFYGFKYNSYQVKLNNFFNILTFILFRFGVLVIIYIGIYNDAHRVTIGYLIMLCSCIFLMTIINIVLFKRLLIKDCLIKRKHSSSKNEKLEQLDQLNEQKHEQEQTVENIECILIESDNKLNNKINEHENEILMFNKINNFINMETLSDNDQDAKCLNQVATISTQAVTNDGDTNKMVVLNLQ